MHVWREASIAKRPLQRVALGGVAGPPEIAAQLQNAILQNQPNFAGHIAMLDPLWLEQNTAVQVANFEGNPSDVGAINAARRAGADVLIEAEVLRHDLEPRPPQPQSRWFRKERQIPESMTVAWKLTDVQTGHRIAQETTVVDREKAEKLYPDLEMSASDGAGRVITAAARNSWDFLSPHLEKENATLALPWFTPGATRMRRGNGYARQGRWDKAEAEWQEVADRYRRNRGAWHNLAMAAVAREDFTMARMRLEHAKSWLPLTPDEASLVWLETQQRAFHSAHQLPPPPGGWTLPDPPQVLRPDQVQSTHPKDIEDMPWWTAIPFTKPPNWTWSQWFSQPWTL